MLLLPCVLAAWLAAVYLGERYVIDLLIGAAYAFAAVAIAPHALALVARVVMTIRSWPGGSRRAPLPEAAAGGSDVFAP